MAFYPQQYRPWTTKRDFSQIIHESHVNDVQDEIHATQTVIGVNPQIAVNDPGGIIKDYGTVAARQTAYARGEQLPYYQGSIFGHLLDPRPTDPNGPQDPTPERPGRFRQRCKELVDPHGRHWLLPIYRLKDDPQTEICGLPLCADDNKTIADGGWQRIPFTANDDPFEMGMLDGVILNETGLWLISLKVDHVPTEDTTLVQARRRARLEIDGRDVTLVHMVRENARTADGHLHNLINWIEILPKGTKITASARVDGTDLTEKVPINAYLRVFLVRCIDDVPTDGYLADWPQSIYKPPPPPRPVSPAPDPVTPIPTPSPGSTGGVNWEPTGFYGGGTVYELSPGVWVGQYPGGYNVIKTTDPGGMIPQFPGISQTYSNRDFVGAGW